MHLRRPGPLGQCGHQTSVRCRGREAGACWFLDHNPVPPRRPCIDVSWDQFCKKITTVTVNWKDDSKPPAKRTRKSTQVNANFPLVLNLRFVWPATCGDLRRYELTLVQLKFIRKIFTVWPASQVSVKFPTLCDLREFVSRMILFGRPSQVRKLFQLSHLHSQVDASLQKQIVRRYQFIRINP